MRKHDVRKWLHAILDLLPVLVIPLFMIFARNENYNSTMSIDVPQYQEVDFNQRIIDGNFTSSDYVASTYGDFTISNNTCTYVVTTVGTATQNRIELNSVDYLVNHKYLIKSSFDVNVSKTYSSYVLTYDISQAQFIFNDTLFGTFSSFNTFSIIVTPLHNGSGRLRISFGSNSKQIGDSIDIFNVQLFDLTQIFGSGNEPTIQEFDQWYTDDYYDYTLSHHELLYTGDVTYSDTDVGSQMFYTLYNGVDKYFNMGNVFNMNGVYEWFNLNIFHGQIPVAMYVVWQIVLYEFVMDLMFLLYGLFMWFIDMVEKLMEKPLKSVK